MTPGTVDATLLRRLRVYLAERFPLAAYLPLLAAGTFAAVAFSRAARGDGAATGLPGTAWAVGTFTLVVFFFFLRVLDEHKDAPQDARHRPELPVPRGVISLRELRGAALLAVIAAILFNARLDPALLVPMAAVLAWAGFMGREFFVGPWLRARPGWYLLSHMVVMPLIFLYATALDWLVAGAAPPAGTGAFLALAFCNGLVIEVGRKLRSPSEERQGVDSYTGAWGIPRATALWLAALVAAAAFALLTMAALGTAAGDTGVVGRMAELEAWTVAITGLLLALLLAAAVPGALLLARPAAPRAKAIEVAAGLWVLGSYALVGVAAWLRLGGAGP